ncbi:MAG: general secretion pathway protein GspM [Opitutae bacterium]|nr:general secretion pathway protein GspM [Opitutae bacterium]
MLVLGCAAAFGVVWLIGASGRLVQQTRVWRGLAAARSEQEQWFVNRSAIEARAARAARSLEPGRTLDATHLIGEVSALSAASGLAPGIDSPRTERAGPFAYHKVQVNFRRADLGALVNFYEALGRRAPYLALEQCALTADRANPAQLNAYFTIFSVEVSPGDATN